MDAPFPIMQTTPGITEPNITAEPLGTEGEMTVGPDDINPFRSVEEQEQIEALQDKREPAVPRLLAGETDLPPLLDGGPRF